MSDPLDRIAPPIGNRSSKPPAELLEKLQLMTVHFPSAYIAPPSTNAELAEKFALLIFAVPLQ